MAGRISCFALAMYFGWAAAAQQVFPQAERALDRQVRAFLESRGGSWRDMNVPAEDGRALHDIIVSRRYTKALEIGTSTGHSGIWIAWALSKTGGKLITIEVDPGRHREALANFKAAGVAGYIDARLGDAHELVPALPGPFDFVFSDADKDWYTKYFRAVYPKLAAGGCFAAHNISERGYGYSQEYLQHVRGLADLATTVTRSGLAVSYRAGGADAPASRQTTPPLP